MAKTRRHLLISACSLLLCILLLAGTTFAWFTDSVTNSGNTIQAGSLSINAFAYDLGEGGITCTVPGVNGDTAFTFEEDGQDLKSDSNPIITETLWEPGSSSAKLLQVTNTGTLATKIRLQFSVSGDLTDALWFDFVQVTSDGSVTGSFTKRPMNTLATFAEDLEIPLSADNGTVYFVLLYGMNQDAGNEYQNVSFSADVSILAKQDTVEADGFGDHQYDTGATYPVASNKDLEEALEQATAGDTILLSAGTFALPEGCSIAEGVTVTGAGTDATKLTVPKTTSGATTHGLIIDQPGVTLSGMSILPTSDITNDNYAGVVVIKEGGTVLDNVTITSSNSASPILITGSSFGEGDTFTLSNSTVTSKARSLYIVDGTNGKVIIDNCDITGIYTMNVNSSNSEALEIEVRDSALHGWTSYGTIRSATFTDTEFSQGKSAYNFLRPYADTTWNSCTFGPGFKIGAGAAGLNYVFTDCEYDDGTETTAGNIKGRLLDPTGDDDKVLNCNIVVDGVSAVLQ